MHPLETERLIIRNFQQDDTDVIYRIVDESLGWGTANPEERWSRIQESYGRHQDPGFDLGEKAVGLLHQENSFACTAYTHVLMYMVSFLLWRIPTPICQAT